MEEVILGMLGDIILGDDGGGVTSKGSVVVSENGSSLWFSGCSVSSKRYKRSGGVL